MINHLPPLLLLASPSGSLAAVPEQRLWRNLIERGEEEKTSRKIKSTEIATEESRKTEAIRQAQYLKRLLMGGRVGWAQIYILVYRSCSVLSYAWLSGWEVRLCSVAGAVVKKWRLLCFGSASMSANIHLSLILLPLSLPPSYLISCF